MLLPTSRLLSWRAMERPGRFQNPRPRNVVASDLKRALTRALRDGMTVAEVRQLVLDHLAQHATGRPPEDEPAD